MTTVRWARAWPMRSASPWRPAASAHCSTRTPPADQPSPFDHFVYCITGDGCMQEGPAAEASSLAGTQKLGNLVVIYDDNRISIEGETSIAFTEDVAARYAAYGWHVQHVDWTNGGTVTPRISTPSTRRSRRPRPSPTSPASSS